MARTTSKCLRLIDKLPETAPFNEEKLEGLIESLKIECLKGNHRRTGVPTPAQAAWREKFKKAAASCKGKPDYRECVASRLKK